MIQPLSISNITDNCLFFSEAISNKLFFIFRIDWKPTGDPFFLIRPKKNPVILIMVFELGENSKMYKWNFLFIIYCHYSGQFLAFLKSCETQDKFPNFLRDLQDLQDSKNFQFFLLFLSFQPEKVINFTTNIFYVLKQCIFLNKSHKRQNKKFFC